LQGTREGLRVKPQLPSDWQEATVKRSFRGADMHIHMKRETGVSATEVYLDGQLVEDGILKGLKSGVQYKVWVKIPSAHVK
jgi:cellobionic acid phosphorylase